MEGLVDYVKRQVKCPECRAEHRIPYNGIQGFPTNVTLTKFLDLHAEITGKSRSLEPSRAAPSPIITQPAYRAATHHNKKHKQISV